MKIAIDPGHGMSNATPGVFDPGAVTKFGAITFAEADIVLRYGLTLKQLCEESGIEFFMTRSSSADRAPVGGRATRAMKAGCTHYISLHLNSFNSSKANGIEVLYRGDEKDRPLADEMQGRLLKVTGLNDHGNNQRLDLAVLKFLSGPAILIELGFITNDRDRNFLIEGANRNAICKTILDAIKAP